LHYIEARYNGVCIIQERAIMEFALYRSTL